MTAAALAGRAGAVLRRRRRTVALVWAVAFVALLMPTLAFRSYGPGPVGELAVNGEFEHGRAPWKPLGDTTVERSPIAHSGAGAMVIRARTAGRRYGAQWILALVGPVFGERYQFSAQVRAGRGAVGKRVVLGITGNRGGTDVETLDEDAEEIGTDWREIDVTETVKSAAFQALDLSIYVPAADVAGETIYVDSVSFARVDPEGADD